MASVPEAIGWSGGNTIASGAWKAMAASTSSAAPAAAKAASVAARRAVASSATSRTIGRPGAAAAAASARSTPRIAPSAPRTRSGVAPDSADATFVAASRTDAVAIVLGACGIRRSPVAFESAGPGG